VGRAGDTAGLAGVINAISSTHRTSSPRRHRLLAGDGRFPTAPSRLWRPITTFACTPSERPLDYQFVANRRITAPASVFYFCHTLPLESLSSHGILFEEPSRIPRRDARATCMGVSPMSRDSFKKRPY